MEPSDSERTNSDEYDDSFEMVEDVTTKSKSVEKEKGKGKGKSKRKDKVSCSSHSKKHKNNKMSIVWDHFEKVENCDSDEPLAKCKYCGAKYACHSKRNGTGTMRYHLDKCTKYPYQKKKDPKQTTLVFKPSTTGAAQSKLECEIFSMEACRRALAEMIILDELPFSFVERIGFRRYISKSIALFEPKFQIPSRITIARDVLKIFLIEKTRLKDMFKANRYRVSLTTDCWTSVQNLNYLVLTAHFIDSDWKLHKRILSFSIIENHKGETIGRMIEKNLRSWGIDKVMTLTVDNASSNDTVVSFFAKRFNSGLLLNGEFLHVRCCAHILNLIVCDAFKDHNECISRIRNAVRFVRSSTARTKKFKKCIESQNISSKSLLCLDISTRWNSTYLMLEAAVKFEKAFEIFEDEEPVYANEEQPLKEDWNSGRMLLKFLEVFYKVTCKISGSLYTTSNLVFHEITTIQNCIRKNSEDLENRILYDVATSMKAKFEKYWGNNEKMNLLLYVAVVLDPRFKLKFLPYCLNPLLGPINAKKVVDRVENVLRRLFRSYSSSSIGSDILNNMDGLQRMDDYVGNDYAFADAFSTTETTDFDKESEIDVYLLETLVKVKDNNNFNILTWWKQNTHRFEILSRISKDILAIPVSTVASESAFSTGGRVVDSTRSSLAPKAVEALICTQNWLRSDPIDLDLFQHIEEDSVIEEGYRAVMEGEKDINNISFED